MERSLSANSTVPLRDEEDNNNNYYNNNIDIDSNRFTIADYAYDYERSEGEPSSSSNMLEQQQHRSQGSHLKSSNSGSSSRVVHPQPTLRLHQYSYQNQMHHPSTSTDIPPVVVRPEYIPSSTNTTNELQPLPSLPHSLASSSHPLDRHSDFDRDRDRDPFDIEMQDRERGRRHSHEEMGDHKSVISEFPEKRDMTLDNPTTAGGTNTSAVGRRGQPWYRRIIPSTFLTKMLITTILIETIIDLTIEGNILYRFNQEVASSDSTVLELENKRRLPIYLIIFGLAHLWQIVLTTIAIRTKNTIQVVAVTLFNFAFLGYSIIQIYELRKVLGDNLATSLTGEGQHPTLLTLPLNVLTALIISVVALASVVLVVLSFFLQREFGWQRYRFLGADLMIREYYTRFQVFECICYFSAFFCAGFGIQFIWLVLNPQDPEYYITWAAFPLLLVILVVGRFAAKYENTYIMIGFMVGLVAGCGYFIFKLVRIWQNASTTYAQVAKSLTTFDVMSLLLLVACGIYGVIVWRNFGKGLKQAVRSKPGTSTIASVIGFWRAGSNSSSGYGAEKDEIAMAERQRRISID